MKDQLRPATSPNPAYCVIATIETTNCFVKISRELIEDDCPWRGKIFTNRDIIDSWFGVFPEFNSDYWLFDYHTTLSNVENHFFQNLIVAPVIEASSLLRNFISCHTDGFIIQAKVIDELYRLKRIAAYLQTVEWGGDGYFFTSNSDAHDRLEVLIEITKCLNIRDYKSVFDHVQDNRIEKKKENSKNPDDIDMRSPDCLALPYWTGTPTEFLELISIPILLDKLGGMGKYQAIDALVRTFGIKSKSKNPINGQRLHKILTRKKTKHPLIDSYINLIAQKTKQRDE
jgi:hypothetical protein